MNLIERAPKTPDLLSKEYDKQGGQKNVRNAHEENDAAVEAIGDAIPCFILSIFGYRLAHGTLSSCINGPQ